MYLFSITILDRDFSYLKRRYRKLSWLYKRSRNNEMDYWTCQSVWHIQDEPGKPYTRERNL